MTSKRDLKDRINILDNKKIDREDYKECEVCGALFNKSKMKKVEIRDMDALVDPGNDWYCQAHAPKHDIEERDMMLHRTRYKVREKEREINYESEEKEAEPKQTKRKQPRKITKQAWTRREEDELIRRFREGQTPKKMAREMGRKRTSVVAKCYKMGLKKRSNSTKKK